MVQLLPAQLKGHALSPQRLADGLPPSGDARIVDLLGDAQTHWLEQHLCRRRWWHAVLLNGGECVRKDGNGLEDACVGLSRTGCRSLSA